MIDTMRFKATCNQEIYEKVRLKSKSKMIWDDEENMQKSVLIYSNPEIEKVGYKIYVQAKDYEHLFIEFSVPKVLLGTNVFLAYPKQVHMALHTVRETIQNHFGIKIDHFANWIVQRADYCYAWKFLEEGLDRWIIEQLYKYNYPRKDPTKKNTSIWFGGTTEKIQFYLKNPEYLAREYKKLSRTNMRLAEYIKESSTNVLRMEITRRKSKLNDIYGKEVNYTDVIKNDYIVDTLTEATKNLTNSEQTVSMNYFKAVNKIYSTYDKRQANNLIQFLNTYYTNDLERLKFNQSWMKKNMHSSSISRNKKFLRKAGVNILVDNSDYSGFKLDIPSPLVVNTQEQFAEIAVAISKLRIPLKDLDSPH